MFFLLRSAAAEKCVIGYLGIGDKIHEVRVNINIPPPSNLVTQRSIAL